MTLNFPHCCTAQIVAGFGGHAADSGYIQLDAAIVREKIEDAIETVKWNGGAVVVATTNDHQTVANEVLRDMGFKHSRWMSKTAHPETKIRIWWYPINS